MKDEFNIYEDFFDCDDEEDRRLNVLVRMFNIVFYCIVIGIASATYYFLT